MSNVVVTTAPTAQPVTLEEAKAWLRVDSNDDDLLIIALIEAATDHAETFTRRALVSRGLTLYLDAFPETREIVLLRPPLSAVSSVKYYDEDGTLQTLSTAAYTVDTRSTPGRVVLNEDYDWPDTQAKPNAVEVAYTAGYGNSQAVPQGLRLAVQYILRHWFDNREMVATAAMRTVPSTAEALLWQYRIPKLA